MKIGLSLMLAGILVFGVLIFSQALAVNQLVSLQGRVLQSGSPATSGNLAVTIWSNQTGGTLLYSDNFANAVSDGFFDLMLGSSSELNLTYGTLYYLDMSISGQDMNWTAPSGGTVNRIEFQSQNGQIPAAQVQYNAINSSHIQNDAITSAKIAPQAVNSSHLNSAGTYYMGKLGIGTTGPSADLEIKSSSGTGALNVTNGTGYPVFFVNASSQKVSIGTTNFSQVAAGHIVQIAAENNVSGGGQLAVTGRTNVGMQLLIGYDTGGNYGKIQAVEQGVAARALALNPIGGNVGIGTTSPGAKLHVDMSGNALSDPIPSYYSAGFTRVGNTAGGWTAGISITSGGTTNVGSSQINLGSGGDNDYTSIVSNYQGTAAGDSNAYLAFGVAAAERMKIRGDGYVGINNTAPQYPLVVDSGRDVVALFDRNGNDGTILSLAQDNTEEGTISVSGTTVSYNAFMGSHYTQLMDGQKELPIGTMVVSTGKIIPLRNANSGNKNDIGKFPYVEKSSRRAQKGAYGVWFAKLSDNARNNSFGDPEKPIYQIAAIGLYQIRVTDTAGNIENGDYIQASPRAGEGERQIGNDGDYQPYLMDKTVAKALVDVDWADVRADPEVGYKWKLIPATLHAG